MVQGAQIFQLNKLKGLKPILRTLCNENYGDLHNRVEKAKLDLLGL